MVVQVWKSSTLFSFDAVVRSPFKPLCSYIIAILCITICGGEQVTVTLNEPSGYHQQTGESTIRNYNALAR